MDKKDYIKIIGGITLLSYGCYSIRSAIRKTKFQNNYDYVQRHGIKTNDEFVSVPISLLEFELLETWVKTNRTYKEPENYISKRHSTEDGGTYYYKESGYIFIPD